MTLRLDASIDADLDRAAALLRQGGLVAFPTETVYGLGADGLAPAAVARIFEAKGRPSDNPLILHVAKLDAALALWRASPVEADWTARLADAFWPGPLTIVLPAAPEVPRQVTAGLDTLAVRVPDHPAALALIERVGRPLAAPSANRSGRPSPTMAQHVLRTLEGRIDAVLDAEAAKIGLESTVLDLRAGRPRILREGGIPASEIESAMGQAVPRPEKHGQMEPEADAVALSPGMRHRHYAPNVPDIHLVNRDELADRWCASDAVLCRTATARELGPREAALEDLPDDPDGYARRFYAALYRLEESRPEVLLIESVPEDDIWAAVRDRIERSAAR